MDVREYLQNTSNDLFIIDNNNNNSETYKAFYDASCSIAGFLNAQGLSKGQKMVIMMDNSVMLAKIYFACLYAGIIVVPVNPSWNKEQIQFIVTHSQARFVLTTSQYSENIQEKNVNVLILSEEDPIDIEKNTYSFATLEKYPKINPVEYLESSNIAIVIYTSGTTSQPKGVIHTIANLIGNGLLFIKTMGVGKKHRFYNMLPMTYLGGYYNLLLIPYLAKGSVVIAKAFSSANMIHFWDSVIQHQVNTLWLVPTIMAILKEMDRNPASQTYCRENIILALAGTAPLSAQLKNTFEDKYGIRVHENYGLSETLFITSHQPQVQANGVGVLLDEIELKILDNQGKILSHDDEGEIVVRTPFVMNGYLEMEDVFSRDRDEYFFTGDIGYLDHDHNLHITGRKKDLIIKGGVNVSPAAIEEIFYQNAAVQECAVVGIPNSLSGEEIIGVIKIKEDAEFQEVRKKLMLACKKHLSVVQIPIDIVKLDEFPHTFTGKIQKAKIRAWLVECKNTAKLSVNEPKENNFFKPSNVVSKAIPALSIAYNTMVYELQSQHIDVTVLSLGEAFFDLPMFDFNTLPFPASYHYSHSRGIPKLRQVLSDYFQDQYDVKFNPDKEIILTAGSKIAIYMVLMALVNPGDEVIIHDPAWVSYPEQVKLCHGIPICVPYYESVYDFEKYITNRTKVLIVNNPNNPRGSVLTLDEIAHLYKLAEKYNLYILSDEAYSDFVVNKEQFISIGNFDKNFKFSIICNSISKNFGISGWRIGYVIANEFLIEHILKLNQHLITCPPTLLEYYIAEYFYDILKFTKPQIADLMVKRKKIIEYIEKLGLNFLEGNTTFYIFLGIAGSYLCSDDFCKKLLEQDHICIVPGIGYGKSCDKFVRVSIGAEPLERIFLALDKIKKLIQDTSESEINSSLVSADEVSTLV